MTETRLPICTQPLWREIVQNLTFTSLSCLMIGLLLGQLSPLDYGQGIRISLAYGLSITLLSNLLMRGLPEQPSWLTGGGSLLIGLVFGTWITMWEIHGEPFSAALLEEPGQLLANFLIGTAFSLTVCFFFYMHYQNQQLRAEQAEKEKNLMQGQLRILQSQLEPHFLFNTIANVQALIDTRPDAARQMLQSLTTLLRANLTQVRSEAIRLEQELELIRAYLNIQQIRMGERLQWQIDCPDELQQTTLPPLLLQPLVENAIRHGLEPRAEGGQLHLSVAAVDQGIRITLEDSGLGFQTSQQQHQQQGLGLNTLRQRLLLFYGDQAQLEITQPQAGGSRIQLFLPQTLQPAATQQPNPRGLLG